MWLGNEDTMQGTDGQLYQWVQGLDGVGNHVGCWRVVNGPASPPAYTRSTTPFLGNVAQSPDGQLYEWVQGVDGLGNAFGFWKRLAKGVRGLARRALPIAQRFAPFVPGGAAALTAATPLLRRVGVAGADGLGELYEAADGSLYQVQGIGADDDLQGLEADDDLNGLYADDELNGIGADDDLNGFGAEDELNGLYADDELNGIAADDDLNGLANEELQGFAQDDPSVNGFVPEGVSGTDGFIPETPHTTPAFSPSPNAPMWAPLW